MARQALLLLVVVPYRVVLGVVLARDPWATFRLAEDVVKEAAADCAHKDDERINQIMWINMNRATDRAAVMIDMFHNESLVDKCMSVKRIRGVEAKHAAGDVRVDKLSSGKCFFGWDSPMAGACGNDIAHRRAYSQCKGPGFCLIMEDDAFLTPGWHDKFLSALGEVPKNWTMIRLGSCHFRDKDDRVNGTHWYSVGHSQMKYYGSHAIVLDKDRATRLVEKIRHTDAHGGDRWTREEGTYLYERDLVDTNRSFESTMKHPDMN